MGVAGIDHVNIRTMDPEGSARFYERALSLTYRPGEFGAYRLHWLYDEAGHAVIHLRIMASPSIETGAIDHVALRCTNRSDVKARLDAMAVAYVESPPRSGLVQIFLRDPHGIALELNFAEPVE